MQSLETTVPQTKGSYEVHILNWWRFHSQRDGRNKYVNIGLKAVRLRKFACFVHIPSLAEFREYRFNVTIRYYILRIKYIPRDLT